MREQFVQPKIEKKERPETRVEKLFGDLKEQYLNQIKAMNNAGVLELLPESGDLGIIDVDGVERPIPSYEDLVALLSQKIELVEANINLEFGKVLIVPFGAPVEFLFERVVDTISNKARLNQLIVQEDLASEYSSDVEVDGDDFLQVDDGYFASDFYYYKHQSEKTRSKSELLLDSEIFPGWWVSMIRDEPYASMDDSYERFEYLLNDGFFRDHEAVITPEEYLTYVLIKLEESGVLVDYPSGRKAGGTFLGGATHKNLKGFNVPVVMWSKDPLKSYKMTLMDVSLDDELLGTTSRFVSRLND